MSSEAFSVLGSNLGKSWAKNPLSKICSEFPGHANIIRCHQMRVVHCGFGIDTAEPFLPDGHRCHKGIERGGVTVPESVGSPIQPQLPQYRF
jgi:hypothetical protein